VGWEKAPLLAGEVERKRAVDSGCLHDFREEYLEKETDLGRLQGKKPRVGRRLPSLFLERSLKIGKIKVT
jgi:hypothetical protein